MSKILLEEMTWPEIEKAMAQGMDTVLVFAASVEQHGPALPEITDTVIGYAEAEDLARRLGNTLVAPVIRPGLSKHHMCFPGSITLRPEVFKGLVEDYVAAYVHHGFKTIVLASSHGGNFGMMAEIAKEQAARYPEVCIVSGSTLDELDNALIEMDKMEGLPEGTCGGHACDWETSVMMMIDENYVRKDKLQRGYVGPLTGELLDRFFNAGVKSVSEIGVMGDPSGADAERGRRYFAYYQNIQEKAIRKNMETWKKERTPYRIQLADEKHIPQIADLYVRSWKKTYQGLLSQDYLDRLNVPDTIIKWSEYISQPYRSGQQNQGIFVALEGEKVLGFAAFKPYHRISSCIYLDSLHVEEGRKGEGIGTALIRAVQEEGRCAKYPQMGVCIVKGNDGARRLYVKLGAEHYQDKVDDFTGEISYSEILVWNL